MHILFILFLITNCKKKLNFKDKMNESIDSKTLILDAARKGDIKVLESFINNKYDINAKLNNKADTLLLI